MLLVWNLIFPRFKQHVVPLSKLYLNYFPALHKETKPRLDSFLIGQITFYVVLLIVRYNITVNDNDEPTGSNWLNAKQMFDKRKACVLITYLPHCAQIGNFCTELQK